MVNAPWSDDPTFNNLAKNKRLKLKKLSWHCANLNCIECDGKIHYKFMKEFVGYKNGQFYGTLPKDQKLFEEYVWDTERESVQLENGDNQTPENTPEGSICECILCHRRPGYDEWKKSGGKTKFMKDVPRGIYNQRDLSDDVREKLK